MRYAPIHVPHVLPLRDQFATFVVAPLCLSNFSSTPKRLSMATAYYEFYRGSSWAPQLLQGITCVQLNVFLLSGLAWR